MKILLTGFSIQENNFPLSLNYIKNYNSKHNIEIKEFVYGKKFSYDINKNSEFAAISYILQKKYDVVAFSCYIWNIEIIKNICRTLKKIKPKLKIVLGGVEVNEDSLDFADFVIVQEGEIAFKELLNYFDNKIELKNVSNLIYKQDNKIIKNKIKIIQNLDILPSPYTSKGKFNTIKIETSRGCVYNCKYCYYSQLKYRTFSLKNVKNNIKNIFENYSFKNLTILDANFNMDKERMFLILDLIESYNKKIYVYFEIKPELMDKNTIKKLEKYTFDINIEMGLQSTDERVIKKCDRYHNLNKIKNTLKLLNKSKIKYNIDLMYGLPEDNFLSFLNSLSFILKYAAKQKNIRAHHFMLLNNTSFLNSEIERFSETNSSMVIKNNKEDVLDLYKTKLFINLINEELKYFS